MANAEEFVPRDLSRLVLAVEDCAVPSNLRTPRPSPSADGHVRRVRVGIVACLHSSMV